MSQTMAQTVTAFTASAEQWLDSLRDSLGQPLEQAVLSQASAMGYLEATLALAFGLVYLLYGFKVFRVLVVLNAAVLGAMLGLIANQALSLTIWAAPVGAALLAALALPLMRITVSVMGGMAGGLLGWFVARSLQLDEPLTFACGAAGLAAMSLLAFVIFREMVICFTSIQGATLAVIGVIAVVLKFETICQPLVDALTQRPFLLPVLVLTPAVVGFVYQHTRQDAKPSHA